MERESLPTLHGFFDCGINTGSIDVQIGLEFFNRDFEGVLKSAE